MLMAMQFLKDFVVFSDDRLGYLMSTHSSTVRSSTSCRRTSWPTTVGLRLLRQGGGADAAAAARPGKSLAQTLPARTPAPHGAHPPALQTSNDELVGVVARQAGANKGTGSATEEAITLSRHSGTNLGAPRPARAVLELHKPHPHRCHPSRCQTPPSPLW